MHNWLNQHKLEKYCISKQQNAWSHQYPSLTEKQELVVQFICIDKTFELLASCIRVLKGRKIPIQDLSEVLTKFIWNQRLSNVWDYLLLNEVGRYRPNDNDKILSTKTIFFINEKDIPSI